MVAPQVGLEVAGEEAELRGQGARNAGAEGGLEPVAAAGELARPGADAQRQVVGPPGKADRSRCRERVGVDPVGDNAGEGAVIERLEELHVLEIVGDRRRLGRAGHGPPR